MQPVEKRETESTKRMTDESWLVRYLLRGEVTKGLINSPGLFDTLLLSHEQTCSHARGVRDLGSTPLRLTIKMLYTNTITAITSRIWIRPPPICPTSQPSSQRMMRMTTTAQRRLTNDITCAPFTSE